MEGDKTHHLYSVADREWPFLACNKKRLHSSILVLPGFPHLNTNASCGPLRLTCHGWLTDFVWIVQRKCPANYRITSNTWSAHVSISSKPGQRRRSGRKNKLYTHVCMWIIQDFIAETETRTRGWWLNLSPFHYYLADWMQHSGELGFNTNVRWDEEWSVFGSVSAYSTSVILRISLNSTQAFFWLLTRNCRHVMITIRPVRHWRGSWRGNFVERLLLEWSSGKDRGRTVWSLYGRRFCCVDNSFTTERICVV